MAEDKNTSQINMRIPGMKGGQNMGYPHLRVQGKGTFVLQRYK